MRTLTRVTLSAGFCLLVAGMALLAGADPAHPQGVTVPKDNRLDVQARRSQMPCSSRDKVVETLSERYGEVRTGYGLSNPREMIEIFTSPSGTWTAVITGVNGSSCVVAVGQHWQNVEPPMPGMDS